MPQVTIGITPERASRRQEAALVRRVTDLPAGVPGGNPSATLVAIDDSAD